MMRILLLDDDVEGSQALAEALARLGGDVVHLRDGNEGLARAVSDHFPLVLVAADLPGMNGFRLCNRIKTDPNAKRSRVFLMANESMRERFAQHERLPTSADAYFIEPIDPTALMVRARAVMPSMDELDQALISVRSEHITLSELRGRILAQDEEAERLLRELAAVHVEAETRSQHVAHLQCKLDELTPLAAQLDAQIKSAGSLTVKITTLEREVAEATLSLGRERVAAEALATDGRAKDTQLAQHHTERNAEIATFEQRLSEREAAHRESFDLAGRAHAGAEDDLHAQLSEARADLATIQAATEQTLAAANARHAEGQAAEKHLAEGRDRSLAAATESLAGERASHARDLAKLKSAQDAAGVEGEARLAALRGDHTEITTALCEMHAGEVSRIRRGSEDALGALRRNLAQAREEHRSALDVATAVVTQAELETVLRERAEGLAYAEERRVRDLADATAAKQEVEWLLAAERDARAVAEVGRARALAEAAEAFEQSRTDATRHLTEERAAHAADLAGRDRAHADEIARTRAELRAEQEALRPSFEANLARAQAEQAVIFRAAQAGARARVEDVQVKADHRLTGEMESRTRQIAVLTQAHEVAIASVRERARGAIEVATTTTIASLAEERAAHAVAQDELESRLRGELEPPLVALEALLVLRAEDSNRLLAERQSALSEVSSLEAEIRALRTELTSVRSKLDNESMLSRVATEQLERVRGLLDRAKDHQARQKGGAPHE